MLYTNYDTYDVQPNTNKLAFDASPKGKGKGDDDKRVIYSCLRSISHNAFPAYSLFYYSEGHSERHIVPKNQLTPEVRMTDAPPQSD